MACTREELKKKVDKTIDKWFGDPLTRKLTSGTGAEYKKMFRVATGQDFDLGETPSERSIDRLDRRIDTFQNRLKKKVPGKIAELFYLPEEFLKGNPIARRTFDQLVINHNYYRGEKDKFNASLVKIAKSLSEISKEMAIMDETKAPNLKKARQELQRRYNEYTRMAEEGMTDQAAAAEAEKYYDDNLSDLGKKDQFRVFEMADDVLRNPELMTDPKTYSKYSRFESILYEWQQIRPELYNSLKNSLGRYISVLKKQNNSKSYENVIENLEKLNNELEPAENYFPTTLLNIFPTVSAITDSIYESKDTGAVSMDQLNTYVDNMVRNVIDKVPISHHVKRQVSEPTDRRNKNVIGVLDTYVRDVTRFNYLVSTSSTLIDGVQKLRDMSNEEIADTTQVYIDYLNDTHGTMLGYNIKSPAYRALARGITSWEFISKLGLNLRSAMRNATQSLQNFVYFGAKGWYEAEQYLKSTPVNKALTSEMQRHGVWFEESREMASAIGLFPETEISVVNGEEVMTWKTDTAGEQFLSGLESVARVTGKPMSWVENNINRNLTFRIAFAERHKQLHHKGDEIKRFIQEHPDYFSDTVYGKEIDKKVLKHIDMEAGRFAAEMVKELHYEYSPFAKPKVLRSAKGAVLGQFATYSINFFNYQRKIAKAGGQDILAGDWGSPEAYRLYRLGMMNLFISGVLNTVTNSDFTNLIQNDTFDRASQFIDMASGDKEKQRRAFFGKGPVIGTLGGPFIADMVTMGNVFGFYDMFTNFEHGDPGILGYLSGYHDYAGSRKDQKVFDVARTINSEIARQLFVVAPRLYNGAGFGQLVALETGIYPSRALKERKVNVVKALRKLPAVGKYIPLPAYSAKKDMTSKTPKTEGQNIMMALEGMTGPPVTKGPNKQMMSVIDNIQNQQQIT